MAIVRELITLLGTEVDTKGFQQYEKGIARVKELAIGVGKLFGVIFAADKIIEFADGLIDTGKEINKLTAQIKLILRPMDDVNTITEGVYELSQRLGVSYVHMLGVYREFANEVRDTKIPTQDILDAVESIQKGFEVARATPEQQQQVMDALQRGFRSGKMRPVSVGLMKDILPPESFNALLREFNLGVGDTAEAKLREMASKGEISAERVINAFRKANVALDAQFDQMPRKLNRVFTSIYNDLSKVVAQIYKLTDASAFMGRVIWYAWTQFRTGVLTVVNALGGLKNVVELVGIALAVAFGPWLIKTLYLATTATLQWAAANAAALAPWLAIGAAVAAVAIGIQDLVYWIQGKPNLIGTWVGPFADLEDQFGKLDFLAPLRGFKDLITGDWSGFEKEMDKTGESAKTLLKYIEDIGVKLGLWKKPQFEGWTSDLNLIIQAMRDFVDVLNQVNKASNEAGKWVRKHILGIDDETLKTPLQFGKDLPKAANEAGKEVGKVIGTDVVGSGTVFKTDPNYWGLQVRKKLDEAFPSIPTPPASTVAPSKGNWYDYLLPGMGKVGEKLGGLGLERKPDGTLGTPGGGGLSMAPSVAPGAIGGAPAGPTTNNVQPVFNQNNNIKVETTLDAAQIGAIIGDKVGALVGEQLGSFSRSLTVGAPRVEAAIQ